MANFQAIITGLDSQKNYTIGVTAVNASGESSVTSVTASTTAFSAPGQPEIVSGTLTQVSYDITFTAVPSSEIITGYRAYLTDGTKIAENSGGRTDTTLSIAGRPAGNVDEIYVVAYDVNGDGAHSLNATVALQPSDFTIAKIDQSDDTIVLSHTISNGASTFVVFSNATQLTSMIDGNGNIVVTGLSVGTEYPNIKVVAHNVDDTGTTDSNTIAVIPTLEYLHSPGVQETFNDGFVFANWKTNAPLAAPSNIVDEDLIDSVGGSAYTGANAVDVANAFDNNENTFLTSTSAVFDFGWSFGSSSQIVKQIRVKTGIDGAASTVRAYTVYGGDASNNWTSIVSGELANIPSSWHEIDMSSNDSAYNQYKLAFTSRWNTTSDIAEVEMFAAGNIATYKCPAGTSPSFYYEFSDVQDLEKAHYVMFEVKSPTAGQFLHASLDGFGSVPITIDIANEWELKYIPVYDIVRSSRKNISQIRFVVTDTTVERQLSFRAVSEEAPKYGVSLNSVLSGSSETIIWLASSTPLAKTVVCYNDTGFDDAFNYIELDTSASSYQFTGLTPSTNHFFGVASKDYDGSITQVTELENPVWIGVPVAPTIAPIISDITATDFTVTFDRVDGADSYEIYLNGVLFGTYSNTDPIPNVSFPDTPAVPIDVTYRAVNVSGNTVDSPATRVIPHAAPTWASPIPTNGIDYDDPVPWDIAGSGYVVSWSSVEGAESYDIEVSADGVVDANGDFVTPLYSHVGITGLSYNIPNFPELIYGKQYYWHVRAVNIYGVGSYFNPANTFIADVPAPVIITPADASIDGKLLFDMDWTPVEPSKWADVNYEWEVVDSGSTVMGTAEDLLSVTAQYTGNVLAVATTYTLRLRGYTALAPRTASDNWAENTFTTIAEAPGAFDLLLPANAALESGNVTFTWEAATKVFYYNLYIDTVPASSPMVYEVSSGESKIINDLPSGQQYSWYVDAVNDFATVQSTSVRTLTTLVGTPVLDVANTVNDTSSQTGGQAIVKWSLIDTTGVVGYRVKWGTVSGTYTNTSPDIVGAGENQTIITGLLNGTSYYFIVTAYDASNIESANSNESNAVLITDVVAPPVTSFNATAVVSGGAIDLDWVIPSEFNRLKIVRKEGAFADAGTDPEGSPDSAAVNIFATTNPSILTYEDDGT